MTVRSRSHWFDCLNRAVDLDYPDGVSECINTDARPIHALLVWMVDYCQTSSLHCVCFLNYYFLIFCYSWWLCHSSRSAVFAQTATFAHICINNEDLGVLFVSVVMGKHELCEFTASTVTYERCKHSQRCEWNHMCVCTVITEWLVLRVSRPPAV